MKLEIIWVKGNKEESTDWQVQTKTFQSERDAADWLRRNQYHILKINDSDFLYGPISHFEIMDILRNCIK